jgi:hypothetical protein
VGSIPAGSIKKHINTIMKISIDFDGIQEGKNYIFQFSLFSDGHVVFANSTPSNNNVIKKENNAPSLSDFEDKSPIIEKIGVKSKKEFKVESSFDGKLGEGKSL